MTPRFKIPDSLGFAVYVYFGDSEHGKPHCHIYRAEHAAVIALGDEQTRPHFLESNLECLTKLFLRAAHRRPQASYAWFC